MDNSIDEALAGYCHHIEVTINDVGKKGDGVGKYMDYLIIVPGTTRGTRTNVKITNISAKTAFGQVTTEAVNH